MDERTRSGIFRAPPPHPHPHRNVRREEGGAGWIAPAAPVRGICYFHEINSSPAGLKVRIKHSVAPE